MSVLCLVCFPRLERRLIRRPTRWWSGSGAMRLGARDSPRESSGGERATALEGPTQRILASAATPDRAALSPSLARHPNGRKWAWSRALRVGAQDARRPLIARSCRL